MKGDTKMLSGFLTWMMRYGALLYFSFLAALLVIAVSNVILMPKLKKGGRKRDVRVSLLVPARNEEGNIERCVRSLLAQDYGNFELIVLDDNSTDSTGEILGRIAREDPRLKIMKGTPLPEGWLGMCWACWQLAHEADGEYLMFFDADTWHEPIAVSATLDVFERFDADMVSGMAKHKFGTLGETLSVSLAPWGMISCFPVAVMHYFKFGFPSMAAGMYMTFKKEKYFECGGHSVVRMDAVLDKSLARIMKRMGMKIILVDATDAVHCRMYHSMKDAFVGFAKNVFATFDYKVLKCLAVFLFMLASVTIPIAYLAFVGLNADAALAKETLALVGMSLLLWTITSVKGKVPLYTVPLYPVTFTIWFLMTMTSVVHAIFGLSSWKGRKMPRPKVRLI